MPSRPIPERKPTERRSQRRGQAAGRMQDEDLEALPETMRRIAEATSLDVVEKLIDAYGGTHTYVPQQALSSGHICRLIGRDNLLKIIDAIGYGALDIPACHVLRRQRRNREIRASRATGMSVMQIARALKLHERTVRRACAGDRGRA